MRLRPLLFVAALGATAYAQPDVRDHRHPGPPPHAPVTVNVEATEAPPPPREEKFEARAGFVFIRGQWDWKDGKWAWTPGHWERERAGKKWREAKWEQRDGKWARTDGDWVDEATEAVPPLPPNGNPGVVPPTVEHHHHHDWKLDHPTVSSYWPTKGKAGTKVTIRGVMFPMDASVLFNGKRVLGALVTPEKIQFGIPGDATSGDIAIDRGHGRPLAVGSFEVAAGFDPEADQKRIEDDRRKAAEAQWADQQKKWAKDRAARETAFHQHEQELATTREQRREQREKELREKWNAAFLADADTQDELTLHAQRVADLERMKDVASLSADAKIGVRIDLATQRENDRHTQRMASLEAAFKTKGGTP